MQGVEGWQQPGTGCWSPSRIRWVSIWAEQWQQPEVFCWTPSVTEYLCGSSSSLAQRVEVSVESKGGSIGVWAEWGGCTLAVTGDCLHTRHSDKTNIKDNGSQVPHVREGNYKYGRENYHETYGFRLKLEVLVWMHGFLSIYVYTGGSKKMCTSGHFVQCCSSLPYLYIP